MSTIMLRVLRMPYDLFWADDTVLRIQHNAVRLEAADEVERLTAELAAMREVERERKELARRVFDTFGKSTNPHPRPPVVVPNGADDANMEHGGSYGSH